MNSRVKTRSTLAELPARAGWRRLAIKRLATFGNGRDHKSIETSQGYPVYGSGGQFAYASEFLYDGESVLFGRKGTIDKPLYVNERFWTVDTMYYTRMRPHTCARFLHYAALGLPFDLYSTNTALPSMTQEVLGNHGILCPDLSEQTQIAKFLDYETSRIDALIDKQQQLIALLKEKRQAVISHAVTKGLNPDAPMRDSGIEWLGEIPAHWDRAALKHHAQIVDCKHVTAPFVDAGVPLASIGEVRGWFVNLNGAKQTTERYFAILTGGGRTPTTGDIIYTRNATVGEAAVVGTNTPRFAMGQDVCLVRAGMAIQWDYLLHCMKSDVVLRQLDLAMVGATFKRVNVEEIRNLLLPIPPKAEQADICEWLGEELPRHESLIDHAETAVDLLKERRTALISAAVTGKIDVRDWTPPETSATQEAS